MAMMAARFKGDIGGRATGQLTRRPQGVDFGMGLTGADMPAFSDNLPVTHDHATDTGIGVSGIQAITRQLDSPGHVMGV